MKPYLIKCLIIIVQLVFIAQADSNSYSDVSSESLGSDIERKLSKPFEPINPKTKRSVDNQQQHNLHKNKTKKPDTNANDDGIASENDADISVNTESEINETNEGDAQENDADAMPQTTTTTTEETTTMTPEEEPTSTVHYKHLNHNKPKPKHKNMHEENPTDDSKEKHGAPTFGRPIYPYFHPYSNPAFGYRPNYQPKFEQYPNYSPYGYSGFPQGVIPNQEPSTTVATTDKTNNSKAKSSKDSLENKPFVYGYIPSQYPGYISFPSYNPGFKEPNETPNESDQQNKMTTQFVLPTQVYFPRRPYGGYGSYGGYGRY